MSSNAIPAPHRSWCAPGDVNAFFGLMLDNVGGMILMTSLLTGAFHMPGAFVLEKMIPGTACGVLIGDLIYTLMALRLARVSGRSDVTAMPLGLDTPSTFGVVFLIIGPAYQHAVKRGFDDLSAAEHAWFLGITMLLASGVFKLACSIVSGWVRRMVPRAGLLGSLTAIALVIISFLPLLDIVAYPVAGLAALAVILATLTARWKLPFRVPGAFGALVVGCVIYYGMHLLGLGPGLGSEGEAPGAGLRVSLPIPVGEWWIWFQTNWREAASYLPIAIPLALVTVIGGIDCTESAAAAGDDYSTGLVIAVEGFATLAGGILGGVIQTTPFIGHPAYKAMGARAGYTLATALFIGAAGVFGYFDWIFYIIPKAVVFPILIFIGLEITAQSFHATPRRHFPAVAIACVPALAYLALLATKRLLPELDRPFTQLSLETQHWIQSVIMLSGGFILTSLLWATALAHMIDSRARAAAIALGVAGVFSWFGVIHSPLESSPIATPGAVIAQLRETGRFQATAHQTPYHWTAAYALAAAIVLGLARWRADPQNAPASPAEPEHHEESWTGDDRKS